jgi:peroxiredoxin Q/BCP
LSDPSRDVARAYGVLGPSGFALRWTFYVGKDGRIAAIDKKVSAGSHGEDVVKQLANLKSEL